MNSQIDDAAFFSLDYPAPQKTENGDSVGDEGDHRVAFLLAGLPARARNALVERLQLHGVEQIYDVATIAEASRHIAKAGIPGDLAVVDLSLGSKALDLVTEFRSSGWPRVAVIADDPSAPFARAAFQAGAQGYFLRSRLPDMANLLAGSSLGAAEILDEDDELDAEEVRAIVARAEALERISRGRAAAAKVKGTDGREVTLSNRELFALQCIAEGYDTVEIAEEMSLSVMTVRNHVRRIGRKLGTADKAQMVLLALRAGAID